MINLRRLTLAALTLATLVPMVAWAQDAPKRLLFLTHSALYAHPSLEIAEAVVTELGEENGFEVTTHQGYRYTAEEMDFSFLTREYLNQFDAIMLQTNGNLPMTDDQKASIVDFVRNGGGLIGTHNASLTFYDYPEFGEMLGGYFLTAVAQNRVIVLKVEERNHPSTRMLGPSWPIVDEFYHFGKEAWDPARPDENRDLLFGIPIPVGFSRDRVNVLLSIDTNLTDIEGLPMVEDGGDYPQAWYREFGDGRVFYTSIGHRVETWQHDMVFRAHVHGGIRWALGLED